MTAGAGRRAELNINELTARVAIQHTMSVYNNAGDRGALSEMMSAFTDEAVLDTTQEEIQGRSAIEAYFREVVAQGVVTGPGRRPSRHHLTTSRVEMDGHDTAHGWTYFVLIRDGVTIQTGIYTDHFAKQGDRWLISRRRVKLEYNADAR
jgi:ketosteroid isomerase-like protein